MTVSVNIVPLFWPRWASCYGDLILLMISATRRVVAQIDDVMMANEEMRLFGAKVEEAFG